MGIPIMDMVGERGGAEFEVVFEDLLGSTSDTYFN